MKTHVIVFPGSNCDRDIAVTLEKLQFKNTMVWHKETKLPKSDLIVIPGGFSYGDYLRSGAIAAKSNILNEVIKAGNDGSLIIGICNGFQILIECGLDLIDLDKKVNTYSKGMRQKVGIAIAFAKEACVYLLDEPASGLDPLASTELSSTLKKLSNGGAAILMASHDIFRVRETCNRIGILKNGVLVKEMDTGRVFIKMEH